MELDYQEKTKHAMLMKQFDVIPYHLIKYVSNDLYSYKCATLE